MNNKGETTINRKHDYYFQIQGQLEVTDRNYCLFAVWTVDSKRHQNRKK